MEDPGVREELLRPGKWVWKEEMVNSWPSVNWTKDGQNFLTKYLVKMNVIFCGNTHPVMTRMGFLFRERCLRRSNTQLLRCSLSYSKQQPRDLLWWIWSKDLTPSHSHWMFPGGCDGCALSLSPCCDCSSFHTGTRAWALVFHTLMRASICCWGFYTLIK